MLLIKEKTFSHVPCSIKQRKSKVAEKRKSYIKENENSAVSCIRGLGKYNIINRAVSL